MRRNARTLLLVVIVLVMLWGARAGAPVDAEKEGAYSSALSETLLVQQASTRTSTTKVPPTNLPQPTQAPQSTPLPERPRDNQPSPSAGTGTPVPDWTGTAAASQTGAAAASQTAAAYVAAQTAAAQVRATLHAAQTQVVEGTQVAGTAVVGAEHTIAAENQATFAARTATGSMNVTEAPTALPTASETATPTPTAAAISVASTEEQIEVLGFTFDRYALGVGLFSAGVVFALLLIVAGGLHLARRRARPRLSTIAPGAQIPYLVSVEPPGRMFALAQSPATIGRDKKHTVNIDDSFAHAETVSRQHARIERRGDRYVLMDGVKLGQVSANGVFVNGRRTSQNYLKDGDKIRFGQVEFILTVGNKE